MSFSLQCVCSRSLSAFVAAVVVCGCLAQAAEGETKPAEKADQAAPSLGVPLLKPESAAEKTPKADPFVVPDGNAETLLKYMQGLRALRPESREEPAVREFLRKSAGAMIQAADKLLAGEATKEQKTEAAGTKFGATMLLVRLDDPGAAAAIEKMPEEFVKLGLPELARDARGVLLQMQLGEAVAGRPGAKTLEQAADAIKAFVAEQPDRETFGLAFGLVNQLEQMGKTDLVCALCHDFVKIYAKSTEATAAELVKALEGTARRLKLVGNPMQVQGTMLDGKPLDWAKYKGKVVLVMFWSTTCEPCIAEFANVEKLYKLYHDRGFEVVGISLDSSREAVDGFLAKTKLPWTTLFDGGKGPGALEHPTAMYYSVIQTPTMILVGADGKVVTLDAHGPQLDEQLEKLLGPAEPKTEIKTPKAEKAS